MGTGPDVRALLADVAGIGPFFAVVSGPEPAGGGWVALRTLARPVDRVVTDPLGERIEAVRTALGTDRRVAASTAFQGLAAQLVAPLFAAAAVHGVLPAGVPGASWTRAVVPDGSSAATCDHDARPGGAPTATCDHDARPGGAPTATCDHDARPGGAPTATRDHDALGGPDPGIATALHWRPGGAGPWLWWAGPGAVVPCPATALGGVLVGLLAPLVAAVRGRASVSPRVLWGDVASAVASARRLVCAARPAASERATDVARAVLTAAPLAATTALRPPEPPDASWTFRRRSCCLYHRAPGGGLCDDCVLHDRHPRT